MLAICIECSHKRGMGHLFRAINIIKYLQKRKSPFILLLNNDEGAKRVLRQEGIFDYKIVDIFNEDENWESEIIVAHHVSCWLNDRLDTSFVTAIHVTSVDVPLYTIDDKGPGASLSIGNFASLALEEKVNIPGLNVYRGLEYLVLNQEIESKRRLRKEINSIIVTLGGSDTYGVTLNVVRFLKRFMLEKGNAIKITIVLGPNARIYDKVKQEVAGTVIEVVEYVPSMISFFYDYDIAFTGGGVTAIEACASGLPVFVTANEKHEIQVGEYLEKIECGLFAGFHIEADYDNLTKLINNSIAIKRLSENCLRKIPLNGLQRIIEIMGICNEK